MSEVPTNESDSQPPKRRFNIELLSASLAIVLSVLSIVVAYRSELTQREMLAASIWPHIHVGHGNVDTDGTPRINFRLRNSGTGPALIRQFQMFDGARPITSVRKLLACCVEPEAIPADLYNVVSSDIDQPVLPANDGFAYVRVDRAEVGEHLWEALNKGRFQMWAQVCYCSVLDDCFLLDSRKPPARSVDSCPEVAWSGFNTIRRAED